ncbi:L-Rhamnulokinase [Commensalibacter sp. Nvir]|uniref:rhamnulokinase n=1 Tax=Commensalibacter sp. Nvir TaxID=3069817 RepID=UPI002D5F746D|nr:L-Rhamnulokinase [Commensalibacter sp. Nvir]
MSTNNVVAIDLGASSGRVMLIRYHRESQTLSLKKIHRFKTPIRLRANHCYWDIDEIEKQIRIGLKTIDNLNVVIDSIGIDTWGVDYVLLDKNKNRIGPVYCYRDSRTNGIMERVKQELSVNTIYEKTGIQFQPFNTLYQLKSLKDENPEWLKSVRHFIMLPDYLAYCLTGNIHCEYTNATTTQLINIHTGTWDNDLINYLNLPQNWFKPVQKMGHTIGYWKNAKNEAIPVLSIASHDTASAVLATPLRDKNCAYLSSGTWSLIGLDSERFYLNEVSRCNNITNEGGVNNRYRVLKNSMGHWLFQRICQEHSIKNTARLLKNVENTPAFTCLIDPNHSQFLNPKSMTKTIQLACKEHHEPIPNTIEQLSRCIFDSLALSYNYTLKQLSALRHTPIQSLHVVGGGSQNSLLNQLCADACQLQVTTGPIEASALGNAGAQFITAGVIHTIEMFRKIISNSFPVASYHPHHLISANIYHRFNRICDIADNTGNEIAL